MSRVYTVMLREHGSNTGLMLYQARAKSWNHVVLIMRLQGIVPKFDVVSHTDRPARDFMLGVMFPRLVTKDENGNKPEGSKTKRFFMPVVCWLKRQHRLNNYKGFGDICKRCNAVFPSEEEVKS